MHRTSGSLSRFPVFDLTGSVRGLLDASGVVTDTYSLELFGKQRSSTGSTPNPYRFGGAWGYINGGSGLQQLGARFYWPDIGRFIQQDPIGDGMNWYAYAYGNPVVYIDPEGLGLRDWYMGGMGGASQWIDCNLLLGQTGRFGNTAGLYDAGQASAWDVAREGGKWGALVGAEAYGTGRAAVAGARAGAVRVLSGNRVKGFTAHGVERMAERRVPLGAVADAVRNPAKVLEQVDALGRAATKYVGDRATVVLNRARRVVTTWLNR